MIKFENVSYSRDIKILDQLGFEVHRGEFIYLTGSSGSGKTTILNLISGQLLPENGNVFVNNESSFLSEEKSRSFISICSQSNRLIDDKTIFENCSYALEYQGLSLSQINVRVNGLLEDLEISQYSNEFPSNVSGGEVARVNLAVGMIIQKPIFLIDEPTANLDPITSSKVISIIENYQREIGATIVVATHDREIIKKHPHRELHIINGQIMELNNEI